MIGAGRAKGRCFRFHLPATAVADDAPLDLGGVLFAGGPEAHVALPVQPRLPVPRAELLDRLEFGVVAIDAALDERHGRSSAMFSSKSRFRFSGSPTTGDPEGASSKPDATFRV